MLSGFVVMFVLIRNKRPEAQASTTLVALFTKRQHRRELERAMRVSLATGREGRESFMGRQAGNITPSSIWFDVLGYLKLGDSFVVLIKGLP
jgi:hypothetical protein